MRWIKLLTLAVSVLCLAVVPVFAQGMGQDASPAAPDMQMQQSPDQDISLDQYSFDQKDQLVDKLNQTQDNISQQMDQAQQQDDSQRVNELQQAQQSMEETIGQVQDANEGDWTSIRDQAESSLNDLQQYEGVIDRGMFESGATSQ
ncbi:MAG: hypothetical protein AB1650_00265 [Candidatus Omnitrophota bacterium]